MKNKRYIDYQYPETDPHRHIFEVAPKKRKRRVDKDYPFEGRGFLYAVLAATIRGLALVILPVWAWLWMRPKIYGKKNLKAVKGQGAVIVANHVHVLDASVICAMVSRARKVRFITLPENMDLKTGGIIKALGGIPIAEDYCGMKEFNKTVFSLLDRKKLVLVYPEISMWPYYTGLRPFKNGAFYFAAKAEAPILPMVFTFKINKKGRKTRLVLNILPAIPPDTAAATRAAADTLKETAQSRMKQAMDEFYSDPKNNQFGLYSAAG